MLIAIPAEIARSRPRPSARRWLAVVFAFVFATCAGCVPGAAETVFPPGSAWGIEPPAGFKPVAGLSAFEHASGAMITIASATTQPYDRSKIAAVGSIVDKGDSATRIEAVTDVSVGGLPGILLTGRLLKDSSLVQMLVVQGATTGTLISVIDAAASNKIDAAAVRSALLTARERKLGAQEMLEALPFRVSDLAGMRIAANIGNQGVILTDGPLHSTSTAPSQPFVSLIQLELDPGVELRPGRDDRLFAERMIKSGFNATTILAARSREVRSMPVIEVAFEKGRGNGVRTGLAWMRRLGQSHVVLIIEAPVGQNPDVGRMERILAGITAR